MDPRPAPGFGRSRGAGGLLRRATKIRTPLTGDDESSAEIDPL